MAFAYLLDPNQQHVDRGGSPNVGGYFKVFLAGTDDFATTYKDFGGTLNPENIPIDLNGRCVIIADSARQYRVEMYWPNGDLVYTQEPVWTLSGGGGGTSIVEVTSTDGTITVDRSTVGSRTTFDLGVNSEDDPEGLDWIRCAGSTLVDGIYVPQKSGGSMEVGEKGVLLEADMLYHAAVSITASKGAQRMAYYDKISVGLALFDGEATTPVTAASRIVDYSCGLSQEFEVCTDIKVGPVPAQLVITVSGQDVQGGDFAISRLDVHRVSSHVAEGGGSFTQVQSDWAQTNSSAVSFIKNKPDLSGFATQTELAQGLAGKQDTISDLATIRSGAAAGATAAQPSDLATVATSGSYNDLSDKPSIPAAQVNSDWNASSGVAEILNKPTIPVVDQTYNAASANAQSGTAVAGALAGVNQVPASTASDEGKVLRVDASGNPEWAVGGGQQVQSDWAQTDSSAVDYIKNKPDIRNVPDVTANDDGKVLQASYSGGTGSYSWQAAPPEVFTAVYGTTTYSEIEAAVTAGKLVNVVVVSGNITSQGILQALRYTGTSNARADFVSPAITLASSSIGGAMFSCRTPGTWSTTSYSQVQADWAQTTTWELDYIKNKPTIPTVDQTYDGTSANAQSGVAVASALAGVGVLPSSTSADAGKVLTVNSSGNAAWETPATPSGGGSGVWWQDPGYVSVDYYTCRLQFKDTSYDPRNDTDPTFLAKFTSITQVSTGIYDFVFAGNYLGPRGRDAFRGKYLAANEFIVVAFNTAALGDCDYVFYGCTGLRAVYNFGGATSAIFSHAFEGCTAMVEFSARDNNGMNSVSLHGAKVAMFKNCKSLREIDMSFADDTSAFSIQEMCYNCHTLEMAPSFGANISYGSGAFVNCYRLTHFAPRSAATFPAYSSQVSVHANGMFAGCMSLQSLDELSVFFLGTIFSRTDSMFKYCLSLTEVPYIRLGANTSCGYMFDQCTALKKVPEMDWANASSVDFMFALCTTLRTTHDKESGTQWYDGPLNANVQSVSSMFSGCYGIKEGLLDCYTGLSSNANITEASNCFRDCGVAWPNAELAQIPSSWGGTGA